MTGNSSVEKKRSRDRRAQSARRARQDAHTQKLEGLMKSCQEEHGNLAEDVKSLRAALEALRWENAHLRNRQATGAYLLHGQKPDAVTSHRPHASPGVPGSLEDTHVVHNTTGAIPLWQQRSKHTPHGDLVATLMPWFLTPAVVLPVDDIPSGVDLLYGSHENPLSNSIHVASICARLGNWSQQERLAVGWMAYLYTKWLFDPSPARYDRLPDFLRPTELQRQQSHTALIDMALWPRIRDNLITTYAESEGELLVALRTMSPTLTTPWPAWTPLLEPDRLRPGRLVVHPDFMNTFTRIENWMPSPEFIENYAHLLVGTEWEQDPTAK